MTEPRPIDAHSLRGLAHPLRVRIVELLWLDGPATATGLAARLGESSGTLSWHLRQLAEHGFIEDDPTRGNKRERWWRYAGGASQLDAGRFVEDPELRGPLSVYLREVLDQTHQRVTGFLGQDWGREWYDAATAAVSRLRLRPEELRALNDELLAVVDRYRAEHPPDVAERRSGEELVVVQIQSFPHRSPDPS